MRQVYTVTLSHFQVAPCQTSQFLQPVSHWQYVWHYTLLASFVCLPQLTQDVQRSTNPVHKKLKGLMLMGPPSRQQQNREVVCPSWFPPSLEPSSAWAWVLGWIYQTSLLPDGGKEMSGSRRMLATLEYIWIWRPCQGHDSLRDHVCHNNFLVPK